MSRNKENASRRSNRWERYLSLAAEAGAIAMSLRDRPTRLDWVGVGLRVTGLWCRIRAERRRATTGDPWSYFDDEGLDRSWIEIPEEFRGLILEEVTGETIVDSHWTGEEDEARVCHAHVGDELVGWVSDGEKVVEGPYLRADREDQTYVALGERLWRRLGTRRCAYTVGGLIADPCAADGDGVLPTEQLRQLESRVSTFLRHGVSRSVLLVGPPGTGKSVGIRYLTRRLDLSTLRIDLAVLSRHHHSDRLVAASLETLLKLLRPEAMILDDLDRVHAGGELLHFLELAARRCKLLIASANCADNMMGAALRPGRFDDVVRVERLDREVLRRLLGSDEDLCERLSTLPVAYLAEFLKRRRVLGRAVALAELEELSARCAKLNQRTDGGN
jgi:hypothetical protein